MITTVRRGLIIGIIAVATGTFAAPAHAQTLEQMNWCYGKNNATLDLQIGGCTAIIKSGKFNGKSLAALFLFRGYAYLKKTQYVSETEGFKYSAQSEADLAIADLNEAIRFDPKLAEAYKYRGEAYEVKGDSDRALADFDMAVNLDPGSVDRFTDRASAYFKRGQ
jgi:tetratricopeptide (TPR) repeat protein